MALKFKIAICLASVTSTLTIFLSIIYGVRIISAFYRGAFTALLFFTLGYVIGRFVESYLNKLLEKDAHKGKNIDVTDKADSNILLEENADTDDMSEAKFKPLNPDDFLSLSSTQK